MGKRKKKQQKVEERKSARHNSELFTSSSVLPNVCIFCRKQSKYTGSNTRETLRCCSEMRVDERIRNIATSRHDSHILSITADELVAKEAKYHPSCYKSYTRPDKQLVKIDTLKAVVKELLENTEGNIVRLTEVRLKLSEEFKRLGVEPNSYLKNLKRSILRHITEVKLLTSTGDIVYYENLTVEDLAALFILKREKSQQFEIMDKNILEVAMAIL